MRLLIAKAPVLFRSTLYGTGAVLPADNEQMVSAWIGSGAAEWADEEPAHASEEAEPKPKKAAKKTAKKEVKK